MASINETLNSLFGAGGPVDVQKMVGPVTELVQGTPGGVRGLVSQLQNSGLRDQVGTWVGSGENAKVDPSRLADAIGPERVQALAAKAGVSVEQARASLSALLPQMIDKLTPGGSIPGVDQAAELARKIPGAEGVTDQVTGLLNSLLAGKTSPAAPSAQPAEPTAAPEPPAQG